MQRVAFTMQLTPGQKEEYKKRHNAIWPELVQLLKESGIYDYSIFLDEASSVLFGTYKLHDNNTIEALPHHAIMKKWWAYMQDIMDTNPDHSPVSKPLVEMFHLD